MYLVKRGEGAVHIALVRGARENAHAFAQVLAGGVVVVPRQKHAHIDVEVDHAPQERLACVG